MDSKQIESIVRDAYVNAENCSFESVDDELREVLKEKSNENGNINIDDAITILLPFYLDKSLEISSKATSDALKKIFLSEK